MRKWTFIILGVISLSALSACNSAKDMTEYVDVSFSGMDTLGTASFDVDENKLISEVLDMDEDAQDFPDAETAEEAEEIFSAYDIKLDEEEDLSNGDTVTVSVDVDEEKTKKIKGGEKEFTVENLDEPEELTSDDVEENLVFNFNGVSGRGEAQIDNMFDAYPMSDISFEVENDGELKNEDEAKISITEEAESELHNEGYMLEDDFNPTVEVKDLDEVAEKASDIENLKDVERFMEEELKDEYKDTDYDYGSNTVYEIDQEKLMYRQFEKISDKDDEDDVWGTNSPEEENGSLIGIYSIKELEVDSDDEKDKETVDEFTVMYGFSGIILDDDKEANLSDLETISEEKDDTYSVDSVIQLYEGEGYEEVKK